MNLSPVLSQHALAQFGAGVGAKASGAFEDAFEVFKGRTRLDVLFQQFCRIHGFVMAAGAAKDDELLAVGSDVSKCFFSFTHQLKYP